MATPILSASDAPASYKPFKCVACGLEGMAAPSNRARKFCYAPCKADDVSSMKRRAAHRATMPAPHSKACTKCGETKEIGEFAKDARSGYRAACKACRNADNFAYAQDNKDKKAANWAARKADPERHGHKLAQSRVARAEASKTAPGWNKRVRLHDAHVKAKAVYLATCYSAHVEAWRRTPAAPIVLHDAQVNEFRQARAGYRASVCRSNQIGALYGRIKASIQTHVEHKSPSRVWARKLGYTMDELSIHLERQFAKGMSWENMDQWHVEHIVAASTFRIESVYSPEFKSCFGLHNLRPLWAIDNWKKGAKREFLL